MRTVRAPLLEAFPQGRPAGRQDKDKNGLRDQAADVHRPLRVDIEKDVAPARDRLPQAGGRGAVQVTSDERPFREFLTVAAPLKFLPLHEVIVDAIPFTGAR